MSLGTGYEYLLRSVARSDGASPATSPLTRYYAESGTPPGRFLGQGLAGLDGGAGVTEGSEATEAMLFNLLGMLADPITGEPLGRRPRHWPTPLAERIRLRSAQVPTNLAAAARTKALAAIETEEKERERHLTRPVAGFDLTFSVPKSVSAVWAIADADTQAAIYHAHREAIERAIGYAEKHIFFTRSGVNGAMQEEIRGVIAAAFDHWDSRAGDPHLHTHVVVANRAQSLDGTWRSLDSRTLFKYVVALSELHEGVVEDLLTARLGYGWEERARRHSPVPRHDVAGVPEGLITEFSQRSQDIEVAKTALFVGFAQGHGRQPNSAEVLQLRQRATLETRPDKEHRSLEDQTAGWRERASRHIGNNSVAWALTLRDRNPLPALRRADLNEQMLRELAVLALTTVSSRRATFSHPNVLAEIHRQLHGIRFADPDERLAVAERTTVMALDQALLLTPAELEAVSESLRRADGTSKLRHRGTALYTTRELLEAETRLLHAGRTVGGPGVPQTTVDEVAADDLPGRDHGLGADQVAAVTAIATSGRVLDVLVGAAGTGKTASLAGLREAWECTYGEGTVIGLAPSAAAAEVLAEELGIDADNTAKWLHESSRQADRIAQVDALIERLRTSTSSPSTVLARRIRARITELEAEFHRWAFHPGQLVIIDEAGLAGTLALDTIVACAVEARAKVVLVGDWAQLSAIEAGGAFAMLVNDRDDPPELSDIRRFTNAWERAASTRLRVGDHAVIDTYQRHGRIVGGSRTEMLDALYRAWRDDLASGLTSLMIASDLESVAALNLRARADRIVAGEVHERGVPLADGTLAGVGDRVITRENNRRLVAGHTWVKNGDAWTVRNIGRDGSLTIQRESSVGRVTLPAAYVRRNLDLGYAATPFRAQGRTVETAHSLIGHTTSREALYVSVTRGRQLNRIYVDNSAGHDPDTGHGDMTQCDVADTMRAVLDKVTADTSAHTIIERERTTYADTPEQRVISHHPLAFPTANHQPNRNSPPYSAAHTRLPI